MISQRVPIDAAKNPEMPNTQHILEPPTFLTFFSLPFVVVVFAEEYAFPPDLFDALLLYRSSSECTQHQNPDFFKKIYMFLSSAHLRSPILKVRSHQKQNYFSRRPKRVSLLVRPFAMFKP